MSPHRVANVPDGFERVKRQPPRYRCTVCPGDSWDEKFVMSQEAMKLHAKEKEHQSRAKKKEGEEWACWNTAEEAWNGPQGWGGQLDPDEELARWLPSDEEKERQQAEEEKRERIIQWIMDVASALLPKVEEGNRNLSSV